MDKTAAREGLRRKFDAVKDRLDEAGRRRWAAAEARELGYGGVSLVAAAIGMTRPTIGKGLRELAGEVPALPPGRRRQPGGGRKTLVAHDPGLEPALREILEANTRGDPEAPLRWTNKSTAALAGELTKQGHPVSAKSVAALLKKMDYSLQGNRKTRDGADHPDRDAQFQYINRRLKRCQRTGQPKVSVDAKKKETLGNLKQHGRTWQPKGQPVEVKVHDFVDQSLGKALPYGVYDLTNDAGWISVGIDHDTAEFAANTLARWWEVVGTPRFPAATELTITADGGGSNAARSRLWKWELQRLANRTGLKLHVHHFPPGTSKWNGIEHKLFSFVSSNWRGQPLRDRATVVNLIGAAKTAGGTAVRVELDERRYATGRKITDAQLATVNLRRHRFHGEWNYTIAPNPQTN